MPAKRRGMADFIAQQRELIEDPLAGDPQPGISVVPATPDPATPDPAAVPAVVSTASVPEPHSPTGHGPLSAEEIADLATCEAALDNLRLAFAVAGKALQVIRDARLYRATHDTFEEYSEQRWDMSRAQAYRLIEAWPLAARLSLSPMGDKLNERQVRELVPLAGRHGPEAAATVYQAVAEADGVRVTAAVLHDVVAMLPAEYFDATEAVEQIRAYLAGQAPPDPPPPPADPVATFTASAARFLTTLRGDAIRAARTANPDAVREVIASVRQVLDELEREATA
jgi:hypothetical protein